MNVSLVGTYPPTACGIATLTADVESSIAATGRPVSLVSILPETTPPNGLQAGHDPLTSPGAQPKALAAGRRMRAEPGGKTTALSIDKYDHASYLAAARQINEKGHGVVLLQHEFGIFGGTDGSFAADFAEALEVPLVLTLHTVLPAFSPNQGEVIRRLCVRAAAVTVFTDTAKRLLINQLPVKPEQVHVIPHGVPTEMYSSHNHGAVRKRPEIGRDARVLSTFGLLSPSKGIELAIQAMAEVVKAEPNAVYVVAGRTHPEVQRLEGEKYREQLVQLASDLGISDHVRFLGRFLSVREVAEVLAITDVFCSPYIGSDQIVSGALSFALAAGCPVVSTPYRYALDMLAGGAGLIVDFNNPGAFADAAVRLLAYGPEQTAARRAARTASRRTAWPAIGRTIAAVLDEAATTSRIQAPARVPSAAVASMTAKGIANGIGTGIANRIAHAATSATSPKRPVFAMQVAPVQTRTDFPVTATVTGE